MRFWLTLIGYGIADTFATVWSAQWLKGDKSKLVLAFLAYCICSGCWLVSLQCSDSPGFTRAMVVYPIWAMLVGVVTGLLITGDQIGYKTWLGIALGLIALTLVAMDAKKS